MGQNWELASNGKYMKQSSQDSPKRNPQERNTAAMDSALDRPDELVGETIFLIRSGQELLSSLRGESVWSCIPSPSLFTDMRV